MAAVNMLKRLAVRDVRFLRELEEGYPYEILGVDRVTVVRHYCCVFHVLKDDAITKVVIENEVFTEPEEHLVCLGAIECVLIYYERYTFRILCYDTMVGELYEKQMMDSDRGYFLSFMIDSVHVRRSFD
jgi:hypothetical protein